MEANPVAGQRFKKWLYRLRIYLVKEMLATCRSANGTDAQIHGRTLSEPYELGRPSVVCVSTIKCARSGWKWFWVLLLKQKDLAAGTNRQAKNQLKVRAPIYGRTGIP